MTRHRQPKAFEALDEGLRLAVAVLELGHDDVVDKEAAVPEDVDKPQHIVFVEDPQVTAHLLALDVLGVDADEDFYVILDALEHRNLVIRGESG